MNDKKRLLKEIEKIIKSFDEKQSKEKQKNLSPKNTEIRELTRAIDE